MTSAKGGSRVPDDRTWTIAEMAEDFGITQEELATRIGRSRPQISNTIRLLKLPVPVQQRVAAGSGLRLRRRRPMAEGEETDFFHGCAA